MKSVIDQRRVVRLNQIPYERGPVIYWMSRDQRVFDNWAILYAMELAARFNTFIIVLFCLVPRFIGASRRQYDFMVSGLREVETDLGKLNIPFKLMTGDPPSELTDFIDQVGVGALVTDFSPLKIKKNWNRELIERIDIPFFEVDSHNIVPCREASQKQEYGAYTIRPKINSRLGEFLVEFPPLRKQPGDFDLVIEPVDWNLASKSIGAGSPAEQVEHLRPGYRNGMKRLRAFLRKGIEVYGAGRNDPNLKAQSGLSPYLHFGQISAQRVALEVSSSRSNRASVQSFLEELIIRRELSDNFCFYNENYDSVNGFPDWALKTLDDHRGDKRTYVYSREELEKGRTHDELWNAAQSEMVLSGGMNGYLRMYWAKKILEWSESPEAALSTAIYLNDKYQLDGRDPNGYAGIAWSIGGVHDRPWRERPVFGKIRYMNESGCRRKFDVDRYIKSVMDMRSGS